MAGKDLSGPGPVRADPRALAGPGRDARRRRLGRAPAGLPAHVWATAVSPWQAILAASRPSTQSIPGLEWLGSPINLYLLVAAVLAVLLNGLAVVRVRAWNASGRDEAVRSRKRKRGAAEHAEQRRDEGRKAGSPRRPRLPFSPSPVLSLPTAPSGTIRSCGAKSAPGPMDGRSSSCD